MSVLLDLGKYVLLSFLKDWLILEDICVLDTSCCNRLIRPKFVASVSSKVIKNYSNKIEVTNKCYLKWLNKRELELLQIVFYSKILRQCHELTNLFENLKAFEFSFCKRRDVERICRLLVIMPVLEEIKLADSYHIRVPILTAIAMQCPKLQKLHLETLMKVSGEALIDLVQRCDQLTHFTFKNCIFHHKQRMSEDDFLLSLTQATCFPKLIYLDIFSYYNKTTYLSLTVLTKTCTRLTTLDISNHLFFTTNLLIELVQNCIQLTDIRLSGVPAVTDKVLDKIGECLPQIKSLDLSFLSRNISEEGMIRLVTHCTQITNLNINSIHLQVHTFLSIVNLLHNLTYISFDCTTQGYYNNQIMRIFSRRFKHVTMFNEKSYRISGVPYTQSEFLPVSWSEMGRFYTPVDNKLNIYELFTAPIHQTHLTKLCFCSVVLTSMTESDLIQWEKIVTQVSLCTNLTELAFIGVNCLTDTHLTTLSQSLTQLVNLGVINYDDVSDTGLCALISSNKNLTSIHIERCQCFTETILQVIGANCRRLHDLGIERYTPQNVSIKCMTELSLKCRQLTTLRLNKFSEKDQDRIARVLVQNCYDIQTVYFDGINYNLEHKVEFRENRCILM